MNYLQTLVSKSILKSSTTKNQTQYTLNRPLRLSITKNVIDTVKKIYRTNYENGGLLVGRVVDDKILIDNIRVIPNQSLTSSAYTPRISEWRLELQTIIQSNLLPFAFHTHPTELGITRYDEKRPNFYVRSSKPDQSVAKQGFDFQDIELLMPECIFVVDSRYEQGINLNFYEGGILPPSVGQLGTTEILTAVIGGSVLAYKVLFNRNKYLFLLMAAIALIFLFEAYRRPYYEYVNGGIDVVFN